jgi:hypothetical protein
VISPASVEGGLPAFRRVWQVASQPDRRWTEPALHRLPFNLRFQESGIARRRRLRKASRSHRSTWARRRGMHRGASPASLSGRSQGATRRPTARSATAHARKSSSGERCGRGAWSQIVVSIRPPCTPAATLTRWMLQEPTHDALVAASLTVSTTLSHPGWRPAAAASWSDGAPSPNAARRSGKELSSYRPPPALRPSWPGGGSCRPG